VADLDGLAREWLYKLQPYRYFDALLNDTDFCPDSILQFLLGKCEVIGVEEFGLYLYMMCNNKLTRFQLAVGDRQCKKSLMDAMRGVGVKEVRERDLIGKRAHATIAFAGSRVVLDMFHNDSVHLGVLRGVDAYLESVWVSTHYGWLTRIIPHLFPPYEFAVNVTVEQGGRLSHTASLSYALEECGIKRRVDIWFAGRELGLWEEEVLAVVLNNETATSIMDELLREVSSLLISALKPLIGTSHLASRAFERSA
jgi:hypothetical protein